MNKVSWQPSSWRERPQKQIPKYGDPSAERAVLDSLSRLPPLVTSWEIEDLKEQLASAVDGRRFLLQGGDCAENFSECTSSVITNKLKILLQMSLVMVHGGKRRVIRVGRFAGQYAKPRSADFEEVDGVTLPTYRGDLINGVEFDSSRREPDPNRMLRGYERSALTLNFIRSLIDGGFADLHHPEYWDLEFVNHSPRAAEYQRMVESIGDSLRFMETLVGTQVGQVDRVDFFTSHEALHLPYEEAQTRKVPHRTGWYNLATHFPWIGMRTSHLEGAHIEYFRGIDNPIAMKVGPGLSPETLVELLTILDPAKQKGRMTLIHRFGAHHVEEELPKVIAAVEESGHPVLWCCDPMHGNTQKVSNGLKTRRFNDIISELEASFDVHEKMGTYLGGVHIELTGENVTECVGGARGLTEVDLNTAYRSQVDPRLNYEQALEMAMLIARHIGR